MAKDNNEDLLMGRYRRIHESWIFGRKVCALSWAAEAFFLRVYLIADDYGNFPADPFLLIAKAGGLRKLGPEEATGYVKEMESKGLVQLYLVGEDEWYGHINKFARTQSPTGPPRAKNFGYKRFYPESPWDNDILLSVGSKSATSAGGPPSASDYAVYKDKDKDEMNKGLPAGQEDPHTVKGLEKRTFVLRSFEHWAKTCEHPNAKLSPERIRILESRWKDSSLDDVLLAVDGCASSDFHMGRQPNNPTKYDDILLICRNRAKVEWFGDKVRGKSRKVDDKKKRQDEAKKRWSSG